MPVIRAQKESRRFPPSGCGGFRFIPWAFAEARPLAFKPPLGFLPSDLCHAGVFSCLANFHLRGRNSTAKLYYVFVRKFSLTHVVHVHNNLHIVSQIRLAAVYPVDRRNPRIFCVHGSRRMRCQIKRYPSYFTNTGKDLFFQPRRAKVRGRPPLRFRPLMRISVQPLCPKFYGIRGIPPGFGAGIALPSPPASKRNFVFAPPARHA